MHDTMILVADQQYRATGAPGAAAAVNIEQHQYKAPSPASAAVAAKQQQQSQVPGRCYYSSKYHTRTWYVQRNTDNSTAVKAYEYVYQALYPVIQ